ncbi:glucosidase II beta subunit-like-domain-containing protein [Globomyces pollinis-pini]|nr:glucosidase II beta subunit-like-domain-containing protein [Globomyces pollinis-pini]
MRTFIYHLFIGVKIISAVDLRGVDPDQQELYLKDTFTCDNKQIPINNVNDNYCDCEDGSDEPGTNACSNGYFYCQNQGFTGAKIKSYRVNDGVCDTECCDGSDEYQGLVSCKNTCVQAARKYKAEQESIKQKLDLGSKARLNLINSAKSNLKSQSRHLEVAELELSNLKVAEASWKEWLNKLEDYRDELQRKDDIIFKRSCEGKLISLKERNDDLTDTVKQLEQDLITMSSLAYSIKQKHQELLKLAEPLLDESVISSLLLSEDESKVETYTLTEEIQNENEQDDSTEDTKSRPEARGVCYDQTSSFLECLNSSIAPIVSRLSRTPSRLIRILHWNGWKKLSHGILRSLHLVEPSLQDAAYLKTQYENSQAEVRKKEDEIRSFKEKESVDFGINSVFSPLYKKCFEHHDVEYTYKICLFEKVTQISKRDGSEISMGTFTKWDHENELEDEKKYKVMIYENGLSCWNGPTRSTVVRFECDYRTSVKSVQEPNKCEYEMIVLTPAVCPILSHSEL